MEDCSTNEQLQQETLCQWTDEYVERAESLMLMRQNAVVAWVQCLLVDVVDTKVRIGRRTKAKSGKSSVMRNEDILFHELIQCSMSDIAFCVLMLLRRNNK